MGWLKNLFKVDETALTYASRNTSFAMHLSMSEIGEMYDEGQKTARDIDPDAFERPRVGFSYKSPISLVGEFNYLIRLCEERRDNKNIMQIVRAALIFKNENEYNLEGLELYLDMPTETRFEVENKYGLSK